MATLATSWAEALKKVPEGTMTAFAWSPRPPEVALDLAVQAAGLVSVPATDLEQAARRGATVWADSGGGLSPLGASSSLGEGGGLPLHGPAEGRLGDGRGGGAIVIEDEGPEALSPEELAAAADRIQEALAPGKGREIAVLGGSPERWPNRALLAWATVHGAALLLAPTPDSLISSAVWARPTLFLGSSEDLAALRRAVELERPPFWDRRRNRLPFGRLRTVVWSGDEEPSPEQVAFWTSRGVLASCVRRQRPRWSFAHGS